MPTTSRSRIVRRAVMVVAVVALLVSWYVGAYCGTYWLMGRGTLSVPTGIQIECTVFAPLVRYDGPGSKSLEKWRRWCYRTGAGLPVDTEGRPTSIE